MSVAHEDQVNAFRRDLARMAMYAAFGLAVDNCPPSHRRDASEYAAAMVLAASTLGRRETRLAGDERHDTVHQFARELLEFAEDWEAH